MVNLTIAVLGLMILCLFGVWIKKNMKLEKRITIESLIEDKGGICTDIKLAPLSNRLIYPGRNAIYYHVYYTDKSRIERGCVMIKYLFMPPYIYKESISGFKRN